MTHSSTDGHLGWFHLLTVVNNAMVNMGVQVSLWDPVLNSFEYVPRSGIARSHGSSIFNFLRKLYTIFPSGCTILDSYQQVTGVPIYPRLHQYWLFSVLLIVPILMDMRWCGISFMISDAEYLFLHLLAVCISSLKKCLFKFFAHFWIWIFAFDHWVVAVLNIFWMWTSYQI